MTELALRPRPLALGDRLRRRAWIVGWWGAGRTLVLATAVVVHVVGPRALTGGDERSHVFGLLGAWDGRWYRIVAEHGYLLEPGRQSDPAFFPVFPLLLRAAHALGAGYVDSGIAIANIALVAALFAFEALTRDLFGVAFARRATTYVALFPLGVVFSMSYPESVVLLAICAAALAAGRRRWLTCAALLALGTLARPEAAFASLPLLGLAVRERDRRGRGRALGAVLAPFAALGSFALYLGLTLHDPLAWTHAERAWGRRFSPVGPLTAVARLPRAFAGDPWVARDVVFFVFYLVLLTVGLRAGAPRAWIAAAAAVVVLPVFSGSFASIGRFGLLAPALPWGLAKLGEGRRADRTIRALSAVLLVAATATLPYVFP